MNFELKLFCKTLQDCGQVHILSDEMDLWRAAHRLDANLVCDSQTAPREYSTTDGKGSGNDLPEPSNMSNRSLRAV